ncbi:MAG: PD-(D/E)XK nuclease family protein [Rikenellaceae bacterium]|nr:PD-(D/E)XK nuclease family protein [Rikenellaceae bacterium]
MQTFLSLLAENLYRRYGDDISSLCIIFPSRRARLFFTEALTAAAGRPLWSPEFRTVDDVMQRYSALTVGERIPLVAELYKVYSRFHAETFDSFYYWGEMLLSDFDSIDKYLIDAGMLFRNIADLKELEKDTGYLEPEQAEIIARFWKSFGHENGYSDEKRKFLDIWASLYDIYTQYRESLASKGIGYPGMVYRQAADNIRAGRLPAPDEADGTGYVIAGFNALTGCEKILFKYLATSRNAEFFWDYDDYYVADGDQEAGLFIRENRRLFPQRHPLGPTDNFARPKRITVVASPSDSMQCKYAGEGLRQFAAESGRVPDKETAIVLTDENLLMPVLSSVPDSIGDINITMGYPLKLTPAYTLYERLAEMQSRRKTRGEKVLFRYTDLTGLLAHPYIAGIDPGTSDKVTAEVKRRQVLYPDITGMVPESSPLATLLTGAGGEWQELSGYLVSALSAVLTSPALAGPERGQDRDQLVLIADNIRRVTNSLAACGLEVTAKVFLSLVRKILQNTRIPFEGEPLRGVQVMGILETRNLDFRNVIVLSMNDDNFPGNRVASYSFIPYNLRLAYGLPTPQHHEGVYAYYFYRLLQRAENVHLVYSSKSDEKSSGEQSRYIYQLMYESEHELRRLGVGLDVTVPGRRGVEIPKTGDTALRLARFLSGKKQLSPTSFHNYIACSLKFYFHSVAGLYEEEEPGEEIDAPMFGTILHRSMELLYAPLCGKDDPRPAIRALIGSQAVAEAVDRAVRDEYLKGENIPQDEYGGNLILVADIIMRYINKCILPYDAGGPVFRITGTEDKVSTQFGFRSGGEVHSVGFRGLADRLDRLPDGRLRVVDYKTGRESLSFNGLETLFSPIARDRNPAAFQTLLYGLILSRKHGCDVQPALYYVRNLNAEGYSHLLTDRERKAQVVSYHQYGEQFEALLAEKLAELFDETVPFRQCDDEKTCAWCEFVKICRK